MGNKKEVVGQIIAGPEELERIEAELLALPMRDAIVRCLTLFDLTVELWLHSEWKDTPAEFEALCLNGDCPLGTSSAKIHIARCLGMITETHGKILKIVKSIRNDCSHRYHVDFYAAKYKDLTRELMRLRGEMALEYLIPSGDELQIEYEQAVVAGDEGRQQVLTNTINGAKKRKEAIEREIKKIQSVEYEQGMLRTECVKLMVSIYTYIYLQFEFKFGDRQTMFGDSYTRANEEYALLYGARLQP